MKTLSVLVVDDEPLQRQALGQILKDQQYEVFVADGVKEAKAHLLNQSYDVVLTDLKMPDGTGLDILKRAFELWPDTVGIVMTAFADVTGVIEAFRAGVADYLLKPVNVESLLKKMEILQERKDLQSEVKLLRAELSKQSDAQGRILGESSQILEVRNLIEQVATTKGTVLITGESGTGKEVAARLIHQCSPQKDGKFIAINCGAIPESLFESELFGHKKGSFTGAVGDKQGLVGAAHKGTLFLDEIGEMPKAVQVKLLRVLQEREITPVGSSTPIKVDVRLIAATNRDLMADVESGQFRKDLFYRINVVELKMPALRDRKEDIPLLSQHFLKKFTSEFKKQVSGFSGEALKILRAYQWPGNVRELENIIERAVILHKTGEKISEQDLPSNILPEGDRGKWGDSTQRFPDNLDEAVHLFSKSHIERILKSVDGDKKQAAQILGLGLSSLYRKLEEPGL